MRRRALLVLGAIGIVAVSAGCGQAPPKLPAHATYAQMVTYCGQLEQDIGQGQGHVAVYERCMASADQLLKGKP